MGDPKKQRKKFSKPVHPWQRERIVEEKELLKQFGLKRKQEIWKASSTLKKFLERAKILIAQRTQQSELEKRQLLDRLYKLGLVKKDSRIEDVLSLTVKNIMDRRLQTLVIKKNLAKSMLQSRQFITHQLIIVGSRKITSPSYIVSVEEEPTIKLVREIKIDNSAKAEPKKEKE